MIVPHVMNIPVSAGSSVNVDCRSRNWQQPVSILCVPGVGGTVEVLTSNDADAMTNGSAKFIDSGNSTMSTDKEITRYAPCTVIKLKATTQPATFRVLL